MCIMGKNDVWIFQIFLNTKVIFLIMFQSPFHLGELYRLAEWMNEHTSEQPSLCI